MSSAEFPSVELRKAPRLAPARAANVSVAFPRNEERGIRAAAEKINVKRIGK
jgi:hypothetical protein